MAQLDDRIPLRVIYKDKSWKKTILLKNGDFNKFFQDLCSYTTKRTKLVLGSQCHITINNNVIYSSDDLKQEVNKADGNSLDINVQVGV